MAPNVSAAWWNRDVSVTQNLLSNNIGRVPQPRLVRAEVAKPAPPVLDADQSAAVAHRGGPLLLLAGPGTGKTTTIVEAVVDRVSRGEITAGQALVLTFSRRAAAELRERITGRLGKTSRLPIARTFHSYAFGLLRAEAALRGDIAPRLLSGPEQDVVVRELLRGDVDAGATNWPARLRPALLTRGFAQELRDLLQRAVERGLSPAEMVALGREHGRDDWVAAGRFARQYEQVSALREAASYDPAELIRAAAALLKSDASVLARVRDEHRFVVVDEYQDTDPAQDQLLQLLCGSRDLIAVGDPDQSIYAFRGADPDGIRRFPERFTAPDGSPATVMTLGISRRASGELLDASRRVAARLGGSGAQRSLVSGGQAAGHAEAHIFSTVVSEAAYVAYRLRSAHLIDGVPWPRMAVLVRNSDALQPLRRSLVAAGVPVADTGTDDALVEVGINRALLKILEVATGRATFDDETGPVLALELLTGPLGDADALAVRRLRQELRRLEILTGGGRSSASLLAEALNEPAHLVTVEPRVAGRAMRVARLIAVAREAAATPDVTAETMLWEVWRASGLAERWRAAALGAGAAAARADRDLDAVVGLFEAAARFTDRLPKAGPQVFLDQMLGQQISGDSLAARAPRVDGVRLLTAHASKGLEWDVVVVAGVQEGRWPDLRSRDSFLGAERLVELIGGAHTAASDVPIASTARLAEERRLFYVAITRARRLLIATAVRADDEQPSRFLDELVASDLEERPISRVPRGLDLAAVVADLRTALVTGPDSRRRAAAKQLARLAEAGVRGAHPDDWYGLSPLTDDAPLADADEQVRVSPSRVEAFERCPLRWMLEGAGGTTPDSSAQTVGSLVHAIAQQAADEQLDAEQLTERFTAAIQRVDLGSGWFAERQRQRAAEMVRKLNAWLAKNPRHIVAAEQTFQVEIGRALLRGTVDRLEHDSEGRLVVVDLKTGKSAPTRKELVELPQLGVYQLAVEQGGFEEYGRESGGAELVQLGLSNKEFRVDPQEPLQISENPAWAAELVEKCADGMAGAVFHAVDNALCMRCPVRSSCPLRDEGRQVTS
jgi:superfamily I DNA/RNA helicase/RecB family exonuclease